MIKLVCINTHIILKYVVNIVLTCLADLNDIIQEPGIRYALQFFFWLLYKERSAIQ